MPRRERMTDQEARKVIRSLRKKLPTLYPVIYRRGSDMSDWGDCGLVSRRGRRYLLIRVADWITWPGDYMILLHEYGHARTWKPDRLELHENEDHGSEWGIKHAEIWRRAK